MRPRLNRLEFTLDELAFDIESELANSTMGPLVSAMLTSTIMQSEVVSPEMM